MTTLRVRLSLEEIETCQRHMDVHAVPGDTGQLLDFCIQQWNRLNKGLLRNLLMEFAHSSGYLKENRQLIHQWFHDISPKWCDRFGHSTSSTFFEFLVPNPGTQYNMDTKHRLVESWLAWVVVQRDQRVYGMVPDIMLFLRSLCDVYHSHFYSVNTGTASMNHPRDLQLLAEHRIIEQQQWADPQDPAQQQGADPQDPAQQQWAERQDPWAADPQDPEPQDPWARPQDPAPPHPDPAPPRRNRWNRQRPSSSAPVEDPDEVSIATFRVYD